MKGLSAQRYDILIPEEVSIILPYENLNARRVQGVDGMVPTAEEQVTLTTQFQEMLHTPVKK
jgi:hypothetical protein